MSETADSAVAVERMRCMDLCQRYIDWSATLPDSTAKVSAINTAMILQNGIRSPGLPVTPAIPQEQQP